MATTPIASLVACSWCGLLAERGVICDACGSPVSEATGRTTVLRVPEASRETLREGLRASSPSPAPPVAPPRRAAARWLNVDQASVMSGVPERTLRGWARSQTPEDAQVRQGDPRFLLIRTPGLKLPDGLWLVDGPKASVVPTAPPPNVAPEAAPETVGAAAPSVPALPPPFPPKPEPTPAPATAVPDRPLLSDTYLEAILAPDELLPESWGFDSSSEERKIFRRHKLLTTAGLVMGFAGFAELIDFLMSHLR